MANITGMGPGSGVGGAQLAGQPGAAAAYGNSAPGAAAAQQTQAQQLASLQGFGQQKQLAQQQIGAQQGLQSQALASQQNQLQSQLASQGAQAQIAASASEYPANLQQSRFNTVYPQLSGLLSSMGGTATGGANQTPLQAAGQLQPGNPISAAPVLNPQQIQQQVNTSRAATDASAATQERNQSATLAGRGLGANSPLASLLNAGTQQNALTANSANETALRYNAAQGNAAQVLQGQQAQSAQNLGAQAAATARQQPIYQQQNSLLAALAGMA
jgi:hypothetical protein